MIRFFAHPQVRSNRASVGRAPPQCSSGEGLFAVNGKGAKYVQTSETVGRPLSNGWKYGAAWILLLFAQGCASVPYRYGPLPAGAPSLPLRPGESQIERGRPNALIDGAGWVVGIPSKIILWNIRMDNHCIRPDTEQALQTYLQRNRLDTVKVRLNQYAPGGEWSRLFRNKSVGRGWRYTLGLLSCAFYTLLPQRIFGGDNYNAYTDTISLYSDVPAVSLHEGGHAKDFASRTWKGTYAFAYALPFFALYPEALATGDAVGYLRDQPDVKAEKKSYHTLYPAYGTYIGGSFSQYLIPYTWVYYVGVIPGHIAGRWKSTTVESRRAREPHEETPVPVPPPSSP